MAEVYTQDNLIAGGTQLVADSVTISAGTLPRGSVLGIVTTDGSYILSNDGASDGSENPVAILAEDVDASSAAQTNAAVYIKGEFNSNALTFGGTHDASTVKTPLRELGIYVKTAVGA